MELKDLSLIDIYRVWRKNTNMFEPFFRSSPFVSLQTYSNFKLNMSIDDKELLSRHERLLSEIVGCGKNEFVICDLDLDDSIEISFALNNKHSIKPIILFNMMFNDYGIVGTKKNIESLVKYGLELKDISPKAFALMLDYGRYADFDESEFKKKLNNQYEVCVDDLPYAEMLNNLGYSKVVFFSAESVKDDVQQYLAYLKDSNIDVDIRIVQ